MVVKNDPRKVLELLGTKHREAGERGLCEQRAFGPLSVARLRHGWLSLSACCGREIVEQQPGWGGLFPLLGTYCRRRRHFTRPPPFAPALPPPLHLNPWVAADPDEEFLDRLAKKVRPGCCMWELEPRRPPSTLPPPSPHALTCTYSAPPLHPHLQPNLASKLAPTLTLACPIQPLASLLSTTADELL